ncbi:MAG: Gfo/Idh/MocA family oxidoreductase [Erysipelotrichaceae bacterium]|nr:Gfo/Idh/MocA family oxidoreductase [Erysipelotrichaceae bacterium]
MKKTRFAIIGSGWRSLYYVRIAKALVDHFELCGLLTSAKEKAELINKQFDIHTTTSIEEIVAMKPDFVVVAVDKAHISEVSAEWLEKGFPVLCETPIGMDIDSLLRIHEMYRNGHKIAVAEQYHLYPENIARQRVIDMGLIGEPYYLNISLASDYHNISLMRRFLNIDVSTGFSITARSFLFPGKETMNRYERFTDGRIADQTRKLALFTFDDNKVALYDFDSDQYRSPIRNCHYKLQGVNGEILNDEVSWLDENNDPVKERLNYETRIVKTDSENPNFSQYEETVRITFGPQTVYEPVFGLRGLSQDETAIALLLKKMGDYVQGGEEPYPLKEGLQDAYMAILFRDAIRTGEELRSQKMPWME